MKVLVKKIIADKFFSAAFWVFLGTGFMNVGNYLYHLLMGRMLGVTLYGALESIISALYILSVPTLTLTLVIVKFVSAHKGKNEFKLIDDIYNYMLGKLLLYGCVFLAVLILLSPLIKSFLHLPSLVLALLLPIVFFLNLFYFLNKSILQGISSFFKFSFLNFLEAFIKVFLAIIFVYLGYRVEGAFGAIVASVSIGLVISFAYIKNVVKVNLKSKEYPQSKQLLKFTIPTFITTLALTSIFTTDVILVRHFFPGVESGYYSALSVLGKIIFFASSPIIMVLFPMISEHHSRGENYKRLLVLGVSLTSIISGIITAVYFLFPSQMVLLLFGEKYLSIAGLLGVFGIFISLLSLCTLLANFYLSIHVTVPSVFVAIAASLQVFLIYVFNKDLMQIIWVSIVICFLLLLSLLLYYPRVLHKN